MSKRGIRMQHPIDFPLCASCFPWPPAVKSQPELIGVCSGHFEYRVARSSIRIHGVKPIGQSSSKRGQCLLLATKLARIGVRKLESVRIVQAVISKKIGKNLCAGQHGCNSE